MTVPDVPRGAADAQPYSAGRFGPQAVVRLRAAFDRSQNPMLIADDQRRWVTANVAACELLGVAREEIPWRTIDDFTPPNQRERLAQRWAAFLASGEAEGWYQLCVPDRGPLPVEFSATANILPSRHLSVFIPPERTDAERAEDAADREASWRVVAAEEEGRRGLTEREREVMTLVSDGLQNGEMAERLFLSQETVKSHVSNAMGKLGARTRAHAVATALVTGQITWKTQGPPSPPGAAPL